MMLRKKYEKYASACLPIQCLFRAAIAKKRTATQKKDKKRLKRLGKKSKKAAIRIQALVRGALQRPRYKQALLKKKEEEDLQNQLDKMKDRLQEAEDQRKRELEDAKFQFEQEMEEYKEKLEDQLRAEAEKVNKPGSIQAESRLISSVTSLITRTFRLSTKSSFSMTTLACSTSD